MPGLHGLSLGAASAGVLAAATVLLVLARAGRRSPASRLPFGAAIVVAAVDVVLLVGSPWTVL